jgi:prepilin-type N-terminal cleavage/methylation domain-containing protein
MRTRGTEAGFSLVELMVAMTITLIVSGAIYGLLAAGGDAFRREPELADRQQNIRAAMDLVSRDVFTAGASLPIFAQTFTIADPDGVCAGGLDGCGMAGSMGPDPTDVVEMVSVDEQCPFQTVCSSGTVAGQPGEFVTREGVPACMNLPGLALLTDNTSFVLQVASASTTSTTDCNAGNARNGKLTLAAALTPWPPLAAFLPAATAPPPVGNVVFMYRGRVVRYRIAPSTDPTDPAPALWRSETGRYQRNGTLTAEPGQAGFTGTGGGSPWEMVARGIEDLQVEYFAGAGPWADAPAVVTNGDWNSLVQRVRITLSARSSAPNLTGQTTSAGGAPDAVRGRLTTIVTPRQAFNELQMCLSAVVPCPAASHIQ